MQATVSLSERRRFDSVLVVGAGIAGIQAALDLSEAGLHVFLVERAPYVGGMLVRLDKTFPTNDCSVCTLAPRDCFLCIRSPRFIDYGRQHRIDVLTGAELVGLEGAPGQFTAQVRELPRFVDEERCSACGRCAEVCPVELKDEFNEGLSLRKAVYRPHPQSFPGSYIIDPMACTRCGECVAACPESCIELETVERMVQLHVGAVILCPGFELFDPSGAKQLGYGLYPDVVTSLEFERLMSTSGPTRGQLARPSNGEQPRKIAWIQCVGSRDKPSGQDYCSSVCCMYALKEAMMVRELLGEQVSTTIFGMDVRAYGKDFDRYYEKARKEYGVRFIRSRIYQVEPGEDGLSIRYSPGAGQAVREQFDMVVLSVGLRPTSGAASLAEAAGVELDQYGFCRAPGVAPVATSRPGVFVAGTFAGPKDVPDTVAEGSAAAARATALVGAQGGGPWREMRATRPEREVAVDHPRIGVVLCGCDQRVSGSLSLPGLAEYLSSLPDVQWVKTVDHACSPEGQEDVFRLIAGSDVDRLVLGACSPRNYELLFRDTVREAGLNGYMLEMANLLEHCALVHGPGAQADGKARELLRMAVGRARLLQPLRPSANEVTPAALVVGGGIAGLTCASLLLNQGHSVYLVEKEKELGGLARQVNTTLDGVPLKAHVQTLVQRVAGHSNCQLFTHARLEAVSGEPGAFNARIRVGPDATPVELPVGAIILATGGREYSPTEYLHGFDPGVVTSLRLDQMLTEGDPLAVSAQSVVMIQCVGSRNDDRPYCSRVCCSQSIKSALRLKELNPSTNVYLLHRDVVTYGLAEEYYTKARERGVVFLRWDPAEPPQVERVQAEDGASVLLVTVADPALGEPVAIEADLVALAAAMTPAEDNGAVAATLGIPLTADGFFLEAHTKLRPVESTREGVFICGLAQGPRSAREQITQAAAAAAKASTILAKTRLAAGAEVAVVEGRCVGCLTCARVCPYDVPRLEGGKSHIDPMACQGCGICVSQCPAGAIQLLHHRSEQLTAQVNAWLGGV